MKRIYLIRHCQAQGQEATAALTAEGVLQAERLAAFFADRPLEVVISSPYERAVATAMPIAQSKSLAIHRDWRLRERVLSTADLPDWMEKLKESFNDMDLKFPGGESSREATERGMAVIHELFGRREQTFAVVTHGNVMSLILNHVDGRFGFDTWRGLTNPDVYELMISEHSMEIHRVWEFFA